MYLHGKRVHLGNINKLAQLLRDNAARDEDLAVNPDPKDPYPDQEGRLESAKAYIALAIRVEANLPGIYRAFCEDKQALRDEPQDLLDLCLDLRDVLDVSRDQWNRVVGESTRRRMNASRAENAAAQAALAIPQGTYEVGERVEVHAMGHWYTGTLVRYATKGGKVLVRYTSGAGVTRDKMVGSDKVRKLG